MTIKDYVNNDCDYLDILNDPSHVGARNVYDLLTKGNPTEQEINDILPFLENMGNENIEVKGIDKLDELNKKLFIQEITFSNAMYKLALEKLINIKKYDILPSSPTLYLFNESITAIANKKLIETTKGNRRKTDRHKELKYGFTEDKKGLIISQKDIKNDDQIVINVENMELVKKGKAIKKIFTFILVKANEQNFNYEIGFSLSELVEKKMYSDIKSARKGFLDAIRSIVTTGFEINVYNHKTKNTDTTGGVIVYNYSIKNSYVTISLNENFNYDLISKFYALLPVFAYGLALNSFDLCEYIFLQARQNTKSISEKGSFNISFDKLRELLSLPLEEAIKARQTKKMIKTPILEAIEAIQYEAKLANNTDFEIIINDNQESNINKWLDGFLTISIKNELKQKLSLIETNKLKLIEKNTKKKNAK